MDFSHLHPVSGDGSASNTASSPLLDTLFLSVTHAFKGLHKAGKQLVNPNALHKEEHEQAQDSAVKCRVTEVSKDDYSSLVCYRVILPSGSSYIAMINMFLESKLPPVDIRVGDYVMACMAGNHMRIIATCE